jgi:hemerythrin superfamily protein
VTNETGIWIARGAGVPPFQELSMPSATATKGSPSDAIGLLTADHKDVKKLFESYKKLVSTEAGDDEKEAVATKICMMLTAHATAEEEIFYPAARDALAEPDLVDEAEVEHGSAKDLIAQIEAMSPGDPMYDATVKVLGEYIDHHVKEEEGEMFPKVRKTDIDLKALGKEIKTRKAELMEEMAAG